MNNDIRLYSNRLARVILIISGWIFVALGVNGILLPVMPTTIFLILAAACFARSSEKFYLWLINNRHLGNLIRDYREHGSMPVRAKVIAILMMNIAIGYSALFAVELLWVKILLFAIAVSVTIYILSLKTLRTDEAKEEFQEG